MYLWKDGLNIFLKSGNSRNGAQLQADKGWRLRVSAYIVDSAP